MTRRELLEAAAASMTGEVCNPDRIDRCKLGPYELRVLACVASPFSLSYFDLQDGAAWNAAIEKLRGSGYLHEGSGLTLKGWRQLAGIPYGEL